MTMTLQEIEGALSRGEQLFRAFRDGAEIARSLQNAVQVQGELAAANEAARAQLAEAQAALTLSLIHI